MVGSFSALHLFKTRARFDDAVGAGRNAIEST